jgi:hypothetical protein
MIKIFFNPNQWDLIFSIAAVLKSRSNELIIMNPVTPDEINEYQLEEFMNQQKEKILDARAEEGLLDDPILLFQEEKIYLFGIYPENKEDCVNLVKFFETHKNRIKLWFDNHEWNKGILHYISEYPKKIKVFPNREYLDILQELGCEVSNEWIEAARAVDKVDFTNKLANRYLTILSAGTTQDENNLNWTNYYLQDFQLSVKELIYGENYPELDNILYEVDEAFEYEDRVKKCFIDNHASFLNAKSAGRPIGYLDLGEINPFISLDDILDYGKKKFPWLAVISYVVNGNKMINADSKKIPIVKILEKYKESYKELAGNTELLLKILEKEVLNFSAKTNTT